jgi:hypothetical protein
MNKTLQLSEEALRLGLAVLGLVLASYLAHSSKPAGLGVLAAGPKPGAVMEW